MENKLLKNLLLGVGAIVAFAAILYSAGYVVGNQNAQVVEPNNNCLAAAPTDLSLDLKGEQLSWRDVNANGYRITAVGESPRSFTTSSTTDNQIALEELELVAGEDYDLYVQSLCEDNNVGGEFAALKICEPDIVIEETIMLLPPPPIDPDIEINGPSPFMVNPESGYCYRVELHCSGALFREFLMCVEQDTIRLSKTCHSLDVDCSLERYELPKTLKQLSDLSEERGWVIFSECGEVTLSYRAFNDCVLKMWQYPMFSGPTLEVTQETPSSSTDDASLGYLSSKVGASTK